MELRQLEYFAAVARHRHFGRAAEAVYITQSALSQQVSRLEQELGVMLLLRTPKGVELTPAGAEFAQHAESILRRAATARAAIDAHRGGLRGIARVAVTPEDAGVLPPTLVAFHRAHPAVRLELRRVPAPQVRELVACGQVDAGVLALADGEVEAGALALAGADPVPAGTVRVELTREPLRLLHAVSDPPAAENPTAPAAGFLALRGVPVVLPERGTALRALIADGCAAAGFSPLPHCETSDPVVIGALVAAGLGRALVPASWAAGTVGSASLPVSAPQYAVWAIAAPGGSPVGDALFRCLRGAPGVVADMDGEMPDTLGNDVQR